MASQCSQCLANGVEFITDDADTFHEHMSIEHPSEEAVIHDAVYEAGPTETPVPTIAAPAPVKGTSVHDRVSKLEELVSIFSQLAPLIVRLIEATNAEDKEQTVTEIKAVHTSTQEAIHG